MDEQELLYPSLIELALSNLYGLQLFHLFTIPQINQFMSGNNIPITISSIKQPVEEPKQPEKNNFFKNIGNYIKTGVNAVGQGIKTGATTIGLSIQDGKLGYNIIQNGLSIANAQMNEDIVNSQGFDRFNDGLDLLSSYVGKTNPVVGLAIKGFQSSINGLNTLNATTSDSFLVDQAVKERMGGSYSGNYSDMMSASKKANLKYGAFNRNAYNEANNEIYNAKLMLNTIQNIDSENQIRQATASNVQQNTMNYSTRLNGGFDARYLRAAKSGIKLEHLNRIKTFKTKLFINIDTKQIEENNSNFNPIIIKPFLKEGGKFEEDWTPIIINNVEIFENGGKTNKSRTIEELIEYAKALNPRFIQRMSEPLRYIRINTRNEKGEDMWNHATHEMNYRDNVVYPMVQEVNGKLHLFEDVETAYANAVKNNNVLVFDNEEEAKLFSLSGIDDKGNYYGYKLGWPEFFNTSPIGIKEEYSINIYKEGGKTESEELVKLEETTLKNVIPEGALHKNKHHIENTKGLTLKGIPVIDNDGELQAEIELDEIIFTLEVTKKLEELHKKYKEGNELAALEAGKLLVQEILYNTDDRTGLIDKCKNGGKL